MKGYESEERAVFPDEDFSKMVDPDSYSNEIEYTTMRRDIDFNGHMHNLYHFDLAYDTLPQNIYENSIFDNFRITYKKEISVIILSFDISCYKEKNALVQDFSFIFI